MYFYFQNSEPGATLSIHSSAVIYRTAPSVVIVGLLQSKFRERQDGSRLLDVIFEVEKNTLIFRNCGLTKKNNFMELGAHFTNTKISLMMGNLS